MAKNLNIQATPERGQNNRPAETEHGTDDPRQAQSATGTVIVACKIPNGLILQCSEEFTAQEPTAGGGYRDVRMFRKGPVGARYVVRGPKVPHATIPEFEVAGGYALTSGIPADFWDRWLEENRNAVFVQRGLIFAHRELASVRDFGRKNEGELSGLEPIDPDRLPRGVQTPVHRIEAADEMRTRRAL